MHRLCSLLLFCCILTTLAFPAIATEPGATKVADNPLGVDFTTPAIGIEETLPHLWDFGDGNTSTEINPSHVYDYPGRYRVTVTIDQGPPQVVVVDAGQLVGAQTFEEWPNVGWTSDPLTRTTAAAIVGAWGYGHDVTDPDTTCSTPSTIPPNRNGGGEDPKADPFRSWVLSILLDKSLAPNEEGVGFELISILDEVLGVPIFGTQIRFDNGNYEIQAYAEDNLVLGPGQIGPSHATPWRVVTADVLKIELQGWIEHPGLNQGGGVRLRVLDHGTNIELVSDLITQIDNDLLQMNTFQFGVLDMDTGTLGEIHLDEYEVLSATCAPTDHADLLGHWDFDDATDLGLDSSGKGREGSVTGGATSVTGRQRTPLISELALALDGTGMVKIPNQGEDLNGAQELTVEAWVKVSSHSQMNVFRSQQPVGLYSDRIVVSNYTQGTGWETLQANPAPPLDTWYHLAGVFDHGQLSIYVNGFLAGSRTLSFDALQGSSFVNWAIGARTPGAAGPDQFFTGEVDDVKIYGRALSPLEIRAGAGLCN